MVPLLKTERSRVRTRVRVQRGVGAVRWTYKLLGKRTITIISKVLLSLQIRKMRGFLTIAMMRKTEQGHTEFGF